VAIFVSSCDGGSGNPAEVNYPNSQALSFSHASGGAAVTPASRFPIVSLETSSFWLVIQSPLLTIGGWSPLARQNGSLPAANRRAGKCGRCPTPQAHRCALSQPKHRRAKMFVAA
jgi:hypothetical protein